MKTCRATHKLQGFKLVLLFTLFYSMGTLIVIHKRRNLHQTYIQNNLEYLLNKSSYLLLSRSLKNNSFKHVLVI